MELYKEILSHALTHGEIRITFADHEPDVSKIVEGVCYQTLQKIKSIIEDDRKDRECFFKIEEIVCPP